MPRQKVFFGPYGLELIDSVALGGGPLGNIELYTPKYYLACTLGGILACGLTHAAVTPLDLVRTSFSTIYIYAT